MTIKELYSWAQEHKKTSADITCVMFRNGTIMVDDSYMTEIIYKNRIKMKHIVRFSGGKE